MKMKFSMARIAAPTALLSLLTPLAGREGGGGSPATQRPQQPPRNPGRFITDNFDWHNTARHNSDQDRVTPEQARLNLPPKLAEAA